MTAKVIHPKVYELGSGHVMWDDPHLGCQSQSHGLTSQERECRQCYAAPLQRMEYYFKGNAMLIFLQVEQKGRMKQQLTRLEELAFTLAQSCVKVCPYLGVIIPHVILPSAAFTSCFWGCGTEGSTWGSSGYRSQWPLRFHPLRNGSWDAHK